MHRELLALRDRVLEGERKLLSIRATGGGTGDRAAAARQAQANGAARTASRGPRLSLDEEETYLEGEGGKGGTLRAEMAELIRQDGALQALVGAMNRAKHESAEALALAQCVTAE